MISSLCILFLLTFYFYFKQYYEKLIRIKLQREDEKERWKQKLTRKLMIIPMGIMAILVLYLISFTLMRLYPDVENVKSSRRVVDILTVLICSALFFGDKRELDKKLTTTEDVRGEE